MPTDLEPYTIANINDIKTAAGKSAVDSRMESALRFAAQKSIDLLGPFIHDADLALGVYTVETTPDDCLYDGDNGRSIFLRHIPVIAVTQVRERIHPSSAWSVVSTDAYVVYLKRGSITRTAFGDGEVLGSSFEVGSLYGWPPGPQTIGVDYTAGYGPDSSELEVIRQFQERLAMWDYLGRGQNPGLISESTSGVYSYTLQGAELNRAYGIPQQLVDMLEPYRLVNV